MSQPDRPKVSVVIPCLDEAAAIGDVVGAAWVGIEQAGISGEVVVVDNASTDNSAEIARQRGARIVVEPCRGYGRAYLSGLAAASGEFIIMGDGDGTYDLSDLPPFLSAMSEGNDLVLGTRLRGEILPGAMPWLHRRIGNPILTRVLNRFFGVKISDAHCGMRALRGDALPKLNLGSSGMELASEMIAKAARARLRITEIPITYKSRIGASKLRTFRDGWRHLRLLLLYSPTYLFFVPGVVMALLGLVVFVPLVAGPIHLFGRVWGIHSMIAAAAALLVGFQLILLGLFARTYAVLYLGEQEPALERWWKRIRLEHGLFVSGLLLAMGLVVLVSIFIEWAGDGFGDLARGHEALAGMTLVGLGTQMGFGSFFLSILGLGERDIPRN